MLAEEFKMEYKLEYILPAEALFSVVVEDEDIVFI